MTANIEWKKSERIPGREWNAIAYGRAWYITGTSYVLTEEICEGVPFESLMVDEEGGAVEVEVTVRLLPRRGDGGRVE